MWQDTARIFVARLACRWSVARPIPPFDLFKRFEWSAWSRKNRTDGVRRREGNASRRHGAACVSSLPWYYYCSKCHFSRVCHSRPQTAPRPQTSESSTRRFRSGGRFHDGVATRPRTPTFSPPPHGFFFIRRTGHQTDRRRVLLVYLTIIVARGCWENYARSEDALGESSVDRPRRLEIVGDPRTMSIVPAIL